MTTINLKDFYYWYTQDQFIEVSDEVAETLRASVRLEGAYQRRLSRHKAQYSLDCDDGIEYSACLHEPTPQELLERVEQFIRLWNALNSLPELQGRRIDAHIILGKSIKEIAEAEGVHEDRKQAFPNCDRRGYHQSDRKSQIAHAHLPDGTGSGSGQGFCGSAGADPYHR